jgi:uncharacterized protein (DUF1810 family)
MMEHSPNSQLQADPFDLARFVKAQEGVYERALQELKQGEKRSHWMWFIFPQIEGLGRSPVARFYSMKSGAEAKAYLAHPLLGARLIECCQVLLRLSGRSASEIFGYPDDLKLRSSMTLFASVSEPGSVFAQVIDRYYEGKPDQVTLDALKRTSSLSSPRQG